MNKSLYRRLIAAGLMPRGFGLRSDAGHPSAPPALAGEGAPVEGTPTAQPPTDPPADDAPKGDETDWKAEARKWEKQAKANKAAAEERDKLKASQMSDQEKAVAAAKAEGHAEAMKTAGTKLATAELKAAAKDKGLDLASITDLIKVEQFVGEDGEVDEKAIKAAVAAFAKIAPAPAPGRSGAPLPGGSGGRTTTNATLDSAVAARYGT